MDEQERKHYKHKANIIKSLEERLSSIGVMLYQGGPYYLSLRPSAVPTQCEDSKAILLRTKASLEAQLEAL